MNFSSKFPESYANQQTPDESRTAQWPKCFNNNSKDEEISANVNNINTRVILERVIKTSLWSMNFLEDFIAGPGLERTNILLNSLKYLSCPNNYFMYCLEILFLDNSEITQ